MIELAFRWFYDYVHYYGLDIVLFLLIGYVFIRCRTIGYAYSAVLVLVLIFFTYVGGYAMPQLDTAIVILLGTLAGGWRYLARARSNRYPLGMPFFQLEKLKMFSLGSLVEKFDLYLTQRRYRKTYAEERAREEARNDARSQRNPQSSTQQSHPRSGQSRRNQTRYSGPKKEHKQERPQQKSKQKQRKERFQRARSSAPPSSSAPAPRNALDVLGLSAGFTQAELRERYKKLASQYHPDKFEHMSDSVKKEMSDEFVAIKQAYEKLKV